ncbi:MAG: glycosyl hydrolase 53 family protein [Mariniphaga sp.]|nr:glycosyl hydrolase 53 family protein [Mariniphaga sp.]
MKKIEDLGGEYKVDGIVKEGFQIFKENGYTWARLRIFHTPNMRGPVCNDLDYTIALAQKAKQFGFKIFLNFHYSDTWADPGKQFKPAAWENLAFEVLQDSVYDYTKAVINSMDKAGVLPELVQVGNEINNGMIWPDGRLWENDTARWDELCALLRAGVKGVKESDNGKNIPIMIHAATGGSLEESNRFYSNIIERGVEFDQIGLSYYPWWHGTFDDLRKNIAFLSENFEQDQVIVETAYYPDGHYPQPDRWVYDIQPYPPTEQGQYDFMVELAQILSEYPKMKAVYYWKPDGMEIPGSGIPYLGRSLFDMEGNAYKAISAWKNLE